MGNGIKLTVLLHLLDSLTISLELLSQLLQLVTLILTTLESTRNFRLSNPPIEILLLHGLVSSLLTQLDGGQHVLIFHSCSSMNDRPTIFVRLVLYVLGMNAAPYTDLLLLVVRRESLLGSLANIQSGRAVLLANAVMVLGQAVRWLREGWRGERRRRSLQCMQCILQRFAFGVLQIGHAHSSFC